MNSLQWISGPIRLFFATGRGEKTTGSKQAANYTKNSTEKAKRKYGSEEGGGKAGKRLKRLDIETL
jgi:hypothetical protein